MLISKTPGGYTFEMTNGEIITLWTTVWLLYYP